MPTEKLAPKRTLIWSMASATEMLTLLEEIRWAGHRAYTGAIRVRDTRTQRLRFQEDVPPAGVFRQGKGLETNRLIREKQNDGRVAVVC